MNQEYHFCEFSDWQGNSSSRFIFKTCCHLYMNLCFLILNNLLEKERENGVENGEHLVRSRCSRVVRSDHGADGDALLQELRMMMARIKNTFSREQQKHFLYCLHPPQVHHSCLQYTHRKANTMITC